MIKMRAMEVSDYENFIQLLKETEGIVLKKVDEFGNFQRYIKRNQGLSVVALDGDQLIAGALVGHDGRRAYIYHLAVKKTYRRQGLAKVLEEKIKENLLEEGIEKAFIWVFSKNDLAKSFWSSCSWEERPDIITMSKTYTDNVNA